MTPSRRIAILFLLGALSACALERPLQPADAHDDVPTPASTALLRQAESCLDRAGDDDQLYSCRDQYQSVLELNPGDYLALARLSTIYTLIGTAYTERRSDKMETFELAMDHAERAMLGNPGFRSRVQAGMPLWEAVEALDESEAEAMFYWATALQYAFQEGMNMPVRIINVRWLAHALLVLQHVERVAPDFGDGGVEFGKAICYLVLPESFGGSEQEGIRLMQASIDQNPRTLLPRWGKAKYFYEITNQPQKRLQELEWVARQDPDDFVDLYPWRRHFVEDARRILEKNR